MANHTRTNTHTHTHTHRRALLSHPLGRPRLRPVHAPSALARPAWQPDVHDHVSRHVQLPVRGEDPPAFPPLLAGGQLLAARRRGLDDGRVDVAPRVVALPAFGLPRLQERCGRRPRPASPPGVCVYSRLVQVW